MTNLHELFHETYSQHRQKEYLGARDAYRLTILEIASVYKEICGSNIDIAYADDLFWEDGDDRGTTALMELAWAGNLEVVKLLVKAGADVNIFSKDGDFALGVAAEAGWQDIFDYLLPFTEEYLRKSATRYLKRGMKYRRKQNRRMTEILVSASKSGDMEQFKIALRLGAGVNLTNSRNQAALHEACCQGKIEIVRALLDAGAEVNLKVKDNTPAIAVLK